MYTEKFIDLKLFKIMISLNELFSSPKTVQILSLFFLNTMFYNEKNVTFKA